MTRKVHQPFLTDHLANAEIPHLTSRQELEQREAVALAPWATRARDTVGRLHPEEEHAYRTVFQRDKDRVIHSTAFRRLEYKTQVFINYEGDYYRTRLTHTIEVSQIARSLSRVLRLNEDLTEAMALAHDLGHTPFGHSGEATLDELMADCGGFNHNFQGLRVVGCLEQRYSGFSGLNLSREVLEIFAKHSPLKTIRDAGYLGPEWDRWAAVSVPVTLEAHVVDLADEIAYNTHDVDDGITSGYIRLEELTDVSIWQEALDRVRGSSPALDPQVQHFATIKHLINLLVTDVVRESLRRLQQARDSGTPVKADCISLSVPMQNSLHQLSAALHERLYRHYIVVRRMDKARRMLAALFERYTERPELLPPQVRLQTRTQPLKRVVCDHLAGMTDRSAEQDYRGLFLPGSAG